jgi:hypothetical protein
MGSGRKQDNESGVVLVQKGEVVSGRMSTDLVVNVKCNDHKIYLYYILVLNQQMRGSAFSVHSLPTSIVMHI